MGSCLWGFTFFLSSRRPREPRSEAGRDMKRKRIRGGQGQGWILFQRFQALEQVAGAAADQDVTELDCSLWS